MSPGLPVPVSAPVIPLRPPRPLTVADVRRQAQVLLCHSASFVVAGGSGSHLMQDIAHTSKMLDAILTLLVEAVGRAEAARLIGTIKIGY